MASKESKNEAKEIRKSDETDQRRTRHPTLLMVNKCDHNELRRKFRNYEI